MGMSDRLAIEQMKHRKPISISAQFLDFVLNMRLQLPIRVSLKYPIGWEAQVPAEDKVWKIECNRGEIKLISVADLIGIMENGGYITGEEEIIDDYQQHFLQELYYSPELIRPLTCDLFCNPDESECHYCPYVKFPKYQLRLRSYYD